MLTNIQKSIILQDAVASSGKIEAEWNDVQASAKAKTSFITKLKRMTSKDGKSKPEKRRTSTAEVIGVPEEDFAATVPLPDDIPDAVDQTPGANTLSKRIRVLMSNLPPFLHTVPETGTSPADGNTPNALTDSKLLGYLSSTEIMNGTKNGNNINALSSSPPKSVWTMLDRLLPYKGPTGKSSSDGSEDPIEEAAETSLMLYAPLVPTADSKVCPMAGSLFTKN